MTGGTPALRVAPLARARLLAARWGRVHSTFARTVNVVLAPGGTGAWVSLHGPGLLGSPFGIACAASPPAALRRGDAVRVDAAGAQVVALRVGDAWRVVLGGAAPATTAVPPAAPAPPLPALLDWAGTGQARNGLLPVAARVLGLAHGPGRDPGAAGDALATAAGAALRALHGATAAADFRACLEAARRLVGLGPGLTPAGDDVLAGWVAGLRTAGEDAPLARRLLSRVAGPLERFAARATSPLSAALLRAAIEGHLAEPARAFVVRPGRAEATALLALGATSGGDFLAGYGLARGALAARRAAA